VVSAPDVAGVEWCPSQQAAYHVYSRMMETASTSGGGGGGGGGGRLCCHAAQAHLRYRAKPFKGSLKSGLCGAVRHIHRKERALRWQVRVLRLAGVQARK
jgi:hypothetical protein